MAHSRLARRIVMIALAAISASSCGGKDFCLVGTDCPTTSPTPNPNTQVTVQGNISSSQPSAANLLSVLVCVDLPSGTTLDHCASGGGSPFVNVVNSDATFTVSGVDSGSERIAFWRDSNNNGEIDSGETFAELQDPNGTLSNVPGGRTVTITNVSVNLTPGSASAVAQNITTGLSPSPTPRPSATPGQ